MKFLWISDSNYSEISNLTEEKRHNVKIEIIHEAKWHCGSQFKLYSYLYPYLQAIAEKAGKTLSEQVFSSDFYLVWHHFALMPCKIYIYEWVSLRPRTVSSRSNCLSLSFCRSTRWPKRLLRWGKYKTMISFLSPLI